MARAKPTADWGFGLVTGVLSGFALAMIFIEPHWITPESAARRYVAVAGLAGAMAVMLVRNLTASLRKSPTGPKDAEPGTSQDGPGIDGR